IAMLSILNLGFGAGYVRYYSRYKKEENREGIFRLNGLFLVIFTVIGLIALICGLFLTNHLNIVFKDGLTATEYITAKTLMLLMSINLAISFPASVFATIISANERFIFLKVISMISLVLGPMVNLPLLLMGFRSTALVVSSLVFSIVTASVNLYYVTAKLGNRFIIGGYEKKLFSSLFSYTSFIAINLIVDQINNGIDKVLLGRFKGTVVVAIYAVGANLYNYYMTISTSVSGVFTPRIHRVYNEIEDPNTRDTILTELFIRVGRIQFLILMLFASGFLIFGKPFICFWVGDGYETSYYVAALLMVSATVPFIQNLGIEIQRAANKHQFRSIVYGFMAICNLLLSIWLCQLYGAVGATIGTAVSLIIANGFIMNVYYQKKIGLDIPMFWRSIIRALAGMIPAFIIGVIIWKWGRMTSVWMMLAYMLLYAAVYMVCIWRFSMNNEEKSIVINILQKAPIPRGKDCI
ncbi:MAG: polysaccharide biosynthesis protein, partial [Parasporobacterium sp.]|nr:polysaccharide biosynthesis protein [Parasporobacterium sp.]